MVSVTLHVDDQGDASVRARVEPAFTAMYGMALPELAFLQIGQDDTSVLLSGPADAVVALLEECKAAIERGRDDLAMAVPA